MKRALFLMFAGTGLAVAITVAQTRDKKGRVSRQEIVTDRPAPEQPAPPTPPELQAPAPPDAPAPPPAPTAPTDEELVPVKPEIPQPPKAPKAPKVMIKIKGC